jgi:hypothetical protein
MRSLVLALLSMRILFGLWSGVSHAVHVQVDSPLRTAFLIRK